MRTILLLSLLSLPTAARPQGLALGPLGASHPPQQHGKVESRDSQVPQRRADTVSTQDHREEPSPDWWLIIPTGILAIGTLGLWKATKDLVRGAEKTAERELRAYVFAGSPRIHDTGPDQRPGIKIHVKNFGKTPAYDCTASPPTFRLVTVAEPPAEGTAVESVHEQMPVHGTMAPGGALELLTPIERPFTASLREGFAKGTKLLYISGEIRYTDAFGAARFTKYRFVYGGAYGSGEGLLATAEEGNEAN